MQDLAADQAATAANIPDDKSIQDRPGLPASHALRAVAHSSNADQALDGTYPADSDGDILTNSATIAQGVFLVVVVTLCTMSHLQWFLAVAVAPAQLLAGIMCLLQWVL